MSSTQISPDTAVLPRERALGGGWDNLGDADVLALVLGSGSATIPVRALAAKILEDLGGLVALSRTPAPVLTMQPGLGVAKGLRIAAGFELARRASTLRAEARTRLSTSEEVAAYIRARVGDLDHEEMWVVALDGQNGARGVRRVAQGGLHGCSVSARDILRAGLAEAASAIVLVHNHPSGDPTPSAEDIAMTRVVAEAADIVGLALVDHVVVTRLGHASMLDLGVLP